jgi:hypothetical protein
VEKQVNHVDDGAAFFKKRLTYALAPDVENDALDMALNNRAGTKPFKLSREPIQMSVRDLKCTLVTVATLNRDTATIRVLTSMFQLPFFQQDDHTVSVFVSEDGRLHL